jgi:predicted molibdopterin-dependent oxidoreductase YjgC
MLTAHPQNISDHDASIRLRVGGRELRCHSGQTVAGALLAHGIYTLRSSPNASGPRGPFCMMGACQECAIAIDGSIRRACQTEVYDGMVVDLHGAGMA